MTNGAPDHNTPPPAGDRGRRRELVTLSVIAGAAASLSVTWLGIAAVDGAAGAPADVDGTTVAPVAVTAPPSSGGIEATAGTLLVPVPQPATTLAPAAPIQPVRRSRAS